MQLKNNCTRNSQIALGFARAITRLLLVQLFFNCTQMSVITYTNHKYLYKLLMHCSQGVENLSSHTIFSSKERFS